MSSIRQSYGRQSGVDNIVDIATETEGNLIVFGEGITREDLRLALGNGQEAIGKAVLNLLTS